MTTPEQPGQGDSDIDAIKRGHVPVVDLEAAASSDPATRSDIAAEVGAACESLGFLVVTGHGVPSETVQELMTASWRYFDLPEDDKRRWMPPSPYVFRGYFPIQSSALAGSLDVETPPDLCEVFAVNRFDDPADADAAGLSEGREGFFAPNIWPDVEGFRDAWTGYYRAMESLADELMALMARALGLEEGWFDDKIDQHISNLVVNHYPAQRTPPVEGQIRRGAHTDYGSLSILYQDDNPGGLQVQLSDGAWADIPHVPGSFVINLGDLMAAWTNDRWVSTMHRVVNPKPEFCDTSRMSVVFFHQPNYDAEIRCIPTCTTGDDPPHYEPVTSGQWVLDKLSKSVY
ncbi:MAG: isopenicillin N synthase family oxygenase [Acidimicrobiia bacterium]|nr:isopenicillin N synthase family oxygenase [Acidimicrobiia bacterium]MYE73242.1 isopenicillin N synthase family oxygenase [Acidimicrobiia bacterium]MYJ62008.1 isopenicillin N synthase family oxygenase [Acidimicrobiia bacterium]